MHATQLFLFLPTYVTKMVIFFILPKKSGASKATAFGGPARRSLKDTTAAGARGPSSARVRGRAGAAFAPAPGSATTPREWPPLSLACDPFAQVP